MLAYGKFWPFANSTKTNRDISEDVLEKSVESALRMATEKEFRAIRRLEVVPDQQLAKVENMEGFSRPVCTESKTYEKSSAYIVIKRHKTYIKIETSSIREIIEFWRNFLLLVPSLCKMMYTCPLFTFCHFRNIAYTHNDLASYANRTAHILGAKKFEEVHPKPSSAGLHSLPGSG
jgi:hypothetical protein